jgi:excinuclease ABC subunit B
MQYERNDQNLVRGRFRLRGDTLTVMPAYEELAVRIDFFGDEVERIMQLDPLTGEILSEADYIEIYPAKHFVTSTDKLEAAIEDIEAELSERYQILTERGPRRPSASSSAPASVSVCASSSAPASRTTRHLARRGAGSTLDLLDSPDDWLPSSAVA